MRVFILICFVFFLLSPSAYAAKPSDKVSELIKSGEEYMLKDSYDEAIKSFDKAISLDPKNPWAYFHRGEAHDKKNELDLAVADYSKAIEFKPSLCSAYVKRGKVYEKQGKNSLALENYNTLLAAYPSYSEGFNSRGELYYRQGLPDAALSDFDNAIRLAPKNNQAYVNRGRVFLLKKMPERAIIDFDTVIANYEGVPLGDKIGDSIAWAYYCKGLACDSLAQTSYEYSLKAADCFKSFLKCYPPEDSGTAIEYAKRYTFKGDPLKVGVRVEVIKVLLEGNDNLLVVMRVENGSSNTIDSVYVGKFDLYLDGRIIGRKNVTFTGVDGTPIVPGETGNFYLRLAGEGQDFRNWNVSIFEHHLNMR